MQSCTPGLTIFQIPLGFPLLADLSRIFKLKCIFSGKVSHNVALIKRMRLGLVGFFRPRCACWVPINGALCGHIDRRTSPLGSMCRAHLLIGKYFKQMTHTSEKNENYFRKKEEKSFADLGRVCLERMASYNSQASQNAFPHTRQPERITLLFVPTSFFPPFLLAVVSSGKIHSFYSCSACEGKWGTLHWP